MLNKDVAGLIKEAADPITYGRLLKISTIFSVVDSNRKKRKLYELLDSLPGGKTPQKPRTAYNFYYYDRKKELEIEHHLLGDSSKPFLYKTKIGQDWKKLSKKAKRPWVLKSMKDKVRFNSETIPNNWNKKKLKRGKVLRELSLLSDDVALSAFKEIRYKMLLRRQQLLKTLRNYYYDNLISWRIYELKKKEIVLKNPVPTPGNTALNLFSKENYEIIKSAFVSRIHRHHTYHEIAANMWHALSTQEQHPYKQKSRENCVDNARKVMLEHGNELLNSDI